MEFIIGFVVGAAAWWAWGKWWQVTLMAKPKGGLTKWFKESWVDISRPKKGGVYALRS